MNFGFWKDLKKPIFALAPMANVTDPAFRRIIAKYGKPDILWTEFVSADGLMSRGRDKLLVDLQYSESERPIVAQLFGANPATMEKAAALVLELGFDGLDLNMGCPDRSVERLGAGAALIKNPPLAREMIRAARRGVREKIPISVKTRLGYNRDELATWLPELLAEKPAAIILHARTRREMSKVPARWEFIRRAVEIRNGQKSQTLILGNGDLSDLTVARQKTAETGADGAMLGRAIFGNPWLFANLTKARASQEKLSVLVEHVYLFEELLGKVKSFAIMKKHFKGYVTGFRGASELRTELMTTETADEVTAIIKGSPWYLGSVV